MEIDDPERFRSFYDFWSRKSHPGFSKEMEWFLIGFVQFPGNLISTITFSIFEMSISTAYSKPKYILSFLKENLENSIVAKCSFLVRKLKIANISQESKKITFRGWQFSLGETRLRENSPKTRNIGLSRT